MRPAFQALAVFIAVWATGLSEPVRAQTIPSPYAYIERGQEAGVYVGYMNAATGRFGFGPTGGQMIGGRYGLQLSGPLSLEGVGGVIRSRRDIVNPGRPEGERVVGSADILLWTVDARLKFTLTGDRTWNRLAPFFVVGGGLAFDAAGPAVGDQLVRPEDVFDFGSSFFGTLGIGTRYFVTDAIALRTDLVFSLWEIDTPPGFSDPIYGFEAVAEGEWARGISISTSVLIRW